MKPQLAYDSTAIAGERTHSFAESVLPALQSIAHGYGLNYSKEAVQVALDWDDKNAKQISVEDLAERIGLDLYPCRPDPARLDTLHTPILVIKEGSATLVIDGITADGIAAFSRFDDGRQQPNQRPLSDLIDSDSRVFSARPRTRLPDARVDSYIKPHKQNWLRKTLFPSFAPYFPALAASLITNVLALAGIIFSMQVYDRVIPAQSYPTLAVLFSAVVLAFFFEFLLKHARIVLLDVLGRNAGLRLSDTIFGRALRVRNDHRPRSTGSFIAQIRDIDTMQETMTSTTVGILMDLPFFILFSVLFWFIGGPLVLIPICALIAIVLPGLILQPKLRRVSQSAQREAALRNAVLVETIQGIEDIKSMQAENRFEGLWRRASAATASAQSAERRIVGGLTSWTQIVQQSVYAVTVAIGAPMVMSGTITTGTLVGASILGSRMIAPMSQVSGLLSRLQQARGGAQGLHNIMKMPIDHAAEDNRVSVARINGKYDFETAEFRHRADLKAALTIKRLRIAPGEKIGLVGRNGAGKSTLLQALSGQMFPSAGEVKLDTFAIDVVDPADVRRDVSYLSQNARLFYGTLRENLMLGRPTATEGELLAALDVAGGVSFLSQFDKGWDYQILEGGSGLSGGQRQSILLARMMLRRPSVLLLDEPTSAMDDTTEKGFIEKLGGISKGRTLIVATHRHRILQLVDRLIVLDKGQLILDGPRDEILAKMRGGGK